VIRPDGGGLRRVTKQAGLHDWPAWSPDGRRIVFITTFGRRESIDVINVDGTRLKRLTTGSRYAYLDWQPLR
jgi:TolB protein